MTADQAIKEAEEFLAAQATEPDFSTAQPIHEPDFSTARPVASSPFGDIRIAPFGPPIKDVPATVASAANQALLGIPKYVTERFGGTYPEPQSLSGKVLAAAGTMAPFNLAERGVGLATRALPQLAYHIATSPVGRAVERGTVGAVAGLLSNVAQPKEYAGRAAGFAAGNVVIPPVVSRIAGLPASYKAWRTRPRPQTIPELMQVPEAEVGRLSATDQKTWFQIKRERLLQGLKADSQRLKEERILLNRELGKSSQQRALDVRERLRTYLPERSQHFRDLFEAEMAGRETVPVEEKELRQFLTTRYAKDPETLAGVSARLGIGNSETLPQGSLSSFAAAEQEAVQPTLFQVIRGETQGIAPHSKGVPGALTEEYQESVPIFLRNKQGMQADEVADILRTRYPQFGVETESDLYAALKAARAIPQKPQLFSPSGKPLPTKEMPPAERTLGSLYQQAKDFGQTLPQSVRQSLRLYNADEYMTDQAIGTLIDLLESKGVNLSASRGFWRETTPVVEQAVREFRPFNLSGTRTQVASSRLRKLALGIDPDNETYAKTLADYLEMDNLPGELKRVVAKLTANQKAQMAIQLERVAQGGQQSPLAHMRYVAGKRHEASVEKWNRVLALLRWMSYGGGALYGGRVLGQMARRE